MFELSIDITVEAVDAIKADLRRTLPNIKSSHRAEAAARGLGFVTYASLLEASHRTDPLRARADGGAFTGYLASRGFVAPGVYLYRAVARVAIERVRQKEYRLTRSGIGVGPPRLKQDRTWETVPEHGARFHQGRDELLSDHSTEQFLRALAFLALVPATQTVRPGTGSYRLKHVAEKYPCTFPEGGALGPNYVANGPFIAAAIHLGFRHRKFVDEQGYDQIGVTFNMPVALLEDLDCLYRPNGARAQDRKRRAEERDRRRRHVL